jgi:hypothetical protein
MESIACPNLWCFINEGFFQFIIHSFWDKDIIKIVILTHPGILAVYRLASLPLDRGKLHRGHT